MSNMQFLSQVLRSRYALLAVGCLVTLALLRTYHDSVTSTFRTAASIAKNQVQHYGGETAPATSNATLGFQEIIYISMDGRTDRSDAMLLLAEVTGIKVTRMSGVNGDDINPKAVFRKPEKLSAGQLGCWRAHVNAWYKVVESGLETALILEDDADWDLALKDEMYFISKALAENGSPLNNTERYPVTATEPYGVGWDMLWVGHCLHDNHKGVDHPGFKYMDPTTPPFSSLPDFMQEELELRGVAKEDGYRTIAKAYSPVCTTGYAVTRRGAQRLLFLLGVNGPTGPVDLDLSGLTREDKLQSILVTPPLMSQWKMDSWQDSEITQKPEESYDGGGGYENGHSNVGERSARKAVKAWALSRDS